MTDGVLSTHLVGYFGTYLPKIKSASPNTIRSYRDALLQLLEFAAKVNKADVNDLALKDIGGATVESFLLEIESSRNVSAATSNLRLSAIQSFFKYVQKRDLSCFDICRSVLSVEKKRVPEPMIAYLSIEEVRVLLRTPMLSGLKGLRYLAILSLLYETAARIQELIDIRICDLTMDMRAVTLHGKGGKARVVPLGKESAAILRRYLAQEQKKYDARLFTGKQGLFISRSGVQYAIDLAVSEARLCNQGMFQKKVTPHVFRHSRAMHLLESGVNIVYISDLLGHASITTTEVYAKANPETKRREIEKHSKIVAPKLRYTKKEISDLSAWLKDILK